MNINFLALLHDRKRRSQVIYDILRPYLHGRVLEMGAGECYLIERINAQDNLEGYGLDIKNYKRAVNFTNFQVYDGKRIPFPDEYFDTVLAVYVLHHIRDQLAVLREMLRVLKPGGSVVLIEDSFHRGIGRWIAEVYDFLTNVGSFQVGREYTFHPPDGWMHILESDLKIQVKECIPLRLGPICWIIPPSVYFKLLIIAAKAANRPANDDL